MAGTESARLASRERRSQGSNEGTEEESHHSMRKTPRSLVLACIHLPVEHLWGETATRWAGREGGQTHGAVKPWTAVKTTRGRAGQETPAYRRLGLRIFSSKVNQPLPPKYATEAHMTTQALSRLSTLKGVFGEAYAFFGGASGVGLLVEYQIRFARTSLYFKIPYSVILKQMWGSSLE
uniref:Uncharacterized protein n=1 Tax=Branchiostoma floridae TaxID=7739 RepID=C3XRL3_BRAFL|eukprot:XP_002613322.1 hypothetical protein BRAFLDRAFT_68289 [Branchiostoma floridae]